MLARKQAVAQHTELRLVITSAEALPVMAITTLDTVLRIYPSLDAAQVPALPGEAHSPSPAG